MPQPFLESKFSSLIDQLNELQERDHASREFEIKKLKREAEKLKSANPAEAFTSLGIIACYEGKIPDMHRFHQNALLYSSEAPLDLANYATSLHNCNLWEEALKYARNAYEKLQADLELRAAVLDMVIDLTFLLGKSEDFLSYANQWLRLTGEKHPLVVVYDFSEQHGLMGHLGTAVKLLKDCFARAKATRLKLEHDPETEEEWLVVEFEVSGKIEDILNSYDNYTDLWISSVPWPEREKIRLSYIAV
jgi:tetratricopeptide (TPR) repeat protein